MTDEEFERLLAEAAERSAAVRALRHADDVWRSLVAPLASEGEKAAWLWLRGRLADALLQMWEPSGRTHDPEALRRVPPARRNDYASEQYLIGIGGLNVLTVAAQHIARDEPAQRATTAALRDVGELLAANLEALRKHPPSWSDQ